MRRHKMISTRSQSIKDSKNKEECQMLLTSRGKNEVSRQTDTLCLDAVFLTPANAFAKALSCRLKETDYIEMY